jgi:hypothetical protein
MDLRNNPFLRFTHDTRVSDLQLSYHITEPLRFPRYGAPDLFLQI